EVRGARRPGARSRARAPACRGDACPRCDGRRAGTRQTRAAAVSVLPAAGVTFPVTVPVVVVGAGAAGLTAALAAREAAAEALVLERDAVPAGSTALSSGLIPAAATRWQAAAGVADTPSRFARDIMAKNAGRADPAIVECVASAAGPTLEWL